MLEKAQTEFDDAMTPEEASKILLFSIAGRGTVDFNLRGQTG
jgi:hypothetical protein